MEERRSDGQPEGRGSGSGAAVIIGSSVKRRPAQDLPVNWLPPSGYSRREQEDAGYCPLKPRGDVVQYVLSRRRGSGSASAGLAPSGRQGPACAASAADGTLTITGRVYKAF